MYKSRLILVLAAAVAFSAAAPALDGKGNANPGVLPPNARAYGKSLAEWLTGYWAWYLGNGGPHEPYQPGPAPIVFLPMPYEGTWEGGGTTEDPGVWTGQIELTLKPGTAFVSPAFAWYGELYLDWPFNDPILPDSLVQGSVSVHELTLDGKPILGNFWDYYIGGPVYFDPPVEYPEPTGYGSYAAYYFQGAGFVCAPLSVGTHTMTLHERMALKYQVDDWYGGVWSCDFDITWNNTWIITVAK